MLNQFGNVDNWGMYYCSIGLEIWKDMEGKIIYFVFFMGIIGIIMGVFRYLKE